MATLGDFSVHGFDISNYQPAAPDLRQGGRQFAMFKATESHTFVDKNLVANRAQAHHQGLVAIGFYHFAQPAKSSAEAQARHFLSVVGAPGPREFAVLDYEVSGWNQAWIDTWGRIVRGAGWKVLLYTYRSMLGPYDRSLFELWVAAYGTTAPPGGWVFWQHAGGKAAGRDPGAPAWDCNVFRGSLQELLVWSGSAAPGPAPTPPAPKPKYSSEDEHMIYELRRRSKEDGTPLDFEGKPCYDGFANRNGVEVGGGMVAGSWLHVRPRDPARGNVKVRIWSDGAVVQAEAVASPPGVGFSIPGNGLLSVLSLDGAELVCEVERNIVPK